jgi:hypothetical protein
MSYHIKPLPALRPPPHTSSYNRKSTTQNIPHTFGSIQLGVIISLTIVILSLLLISLPETAQGCTWTTPANADVEPGETAHFFIRAWNNDNPGGASVKFEVTQDISYYESENTRFYIYTGQRDTAYFDVFTYGIEANEIHTNVTYYEKGEFDDEYREQGARFFTTRIHHEAEAEQTHIEDTKSNNVFLAAGVITFLGIALYFLYQRGIMSIPFVKGNTKLKKNSLLDNEARRSIWELVSDYEQGLSLQDIQWELGIEHKRLIEYHLKKLMEFGYVRKVDMEYYPVGAKTKRPFISEIRRAMEHGAETPEEVARHIGSYREKVRYHMKKHNMW